MRVFKHLYFWTSFLFLSCQHLPAQKQVSDKEYQQLLESLLSHNVSEISIDEAVELSDPIFIDAREKIEFEVSHIKNAIHVGFIDYKPDVLNEIFKTDTIIVYCSVGYRSEKITEKLNEAGFENVYNLFGGIFEWKNQGQPVVNDHGATEEIHAYNKRWGKWLKKGDKVY